MKPTIGRIVHYTQYDSHDPTPKVHAAIISAVHEDEAVSLHVLVPQGAFPIRFDHNVAKTEAPPGTAKARGCWNWPPRVPPSDLPPFAKPGLCNAQLSRADSDLCVLPEDHDGEHRS